MEEESKAKATAECDLEERKIKDIEQILRNHIKSKTLTEDAYQYMSLLVNEDCPKNTVELVSLVGDFMTDGMVYQEHEVKKHCETMMKLFLEKNLLKVEQRDTILAEKLKNAVVISEIKQTGHSGVIREEEFLDPFLDADKTEGNYNEIRDKPFDKKKKK